MSMPVLRTSPLPAPPGDYLGPARAARVDGREVDIELPGGASARARLALAFLYEPAPGDTLLVIGRGADHYVIGVLDGAGRTALTLPGDVELRAAGGELRLTGDRGVAIAGPEVSIGAGTLRVLAESAVEKLGSLYQRVSEVLSVRARESHTVIDEAAFTKARSAAILTEETMSINGKQIHLG